MVGEMVAGSIKVMLGLDSSGLKTGLDQAKTSLTEWRDETNKSTVSILEWGSALAAEAAPIAAIALATYESTIKAAAFADTLNDASDATGVSYENLQRLRAAGIATGTSFESITSTMRMYSQRVAEGGEAGEKLRANLADIGVQVKDSNGNWKDASVLFMETNARLSEMPNTFERNQLAMQIYGRGWSSIASLIKDSKEAEDAFYAANPIDDETLDKAHDYQIEIGQVGEKFDHLVVVVGNNLVPAFSALTGVVGGFFDIETRGIDAMQRSMGDLDSFLLNPSGGLAQYSSILDAISVNKVKDMNAARTAALKQWSPEIETAQLENPYLNLSDREMEIKHLKDVTIPDYVEKLKAATIGTNAYSDAQYNLAKAQAELKNKEDELANGKIEDRTKALTQAYKDEQAAIKDLYNDKQKLANLDQDYAQDLQNAGRDPTAVRSAMQAYAKSKRSIMQDALTDEQKLTAATTQIGGISTGKALSQIVGTDQYAESQAQMQAKAATATGGHVVISGNIYLSGDKSFENYVSGLRKSQGIPVAAR